MAARLRKLKKANLAENSSDDSDDSDYTNTKKLSYKDKQKKTYFKSINNLCDTDSSSDSKVSKEFCKSRLAAASRVGTRQKDCEVIELSDSAEVSDPSDSKTKMSKQNTKDKKKRKRDSVSEESTPESPEKSTKVKKKLRSSNEKSSKHSSKNNSYIDNNDSSSSKEFQEPKAKRKSNLHNSLEQCEMNDYSTVNTPSRTDEDKLSVESAQEISFKHYVIQEIKKFQELNNKMQEDLELNNNYLLKKKIKTVSDAKFFVHKILNIYDSTFKKFRENRKDFVKTYDTWTSDVSKKPKEVMKKSRFSLSSDESDDNIEAPSNKEKSVNVTKNGSFSEKAKKDNNESTAPEAASIDDSIDARLSRSASKPKPKRSEVGTPVSDGNETDKRPEASSDGENKSPRKEKQSKLKLKAKMNESVLSKKAAEESDADSVVQASGCDSDAIFSSEESKSKRKGKTEKKAEETNETPSSKEKPAIEDADSRSSASEDLFETTTGEVVNTPVKPTKAPRIPIDVNVIVDTHNEIDEIVEEASKETEEPAMLKTVEDPTEREALQKLMADDSSDADADSEDEDDDEEGATAKGRAKHLKKQTKKRNLCSDSSSSDDAKGTSLRLKRRGGRNNSEASNLRTAPRQRIDLRNNRFYLADEKLRRECRVEVERLPASELARHARALEKSKDYVERKKIERYNAHERKLLKVHHLQL